jgi:hypothetical protein
LDGGANATTTTLLLGKPMVAIAAAAHSTATTMTAGDGTVVLILIVLASFLSSVWIPISLLVARTNVTHTQPFFCGLKTQQRYPISCCWCEL